MVFFLKNLDLKIFVEDAIFTPNLIYEYDSFI